MRPTLYATLAMCLLAASCATPTPRISDADTPPQPTATVAEPKDTDGDAIADHADLCPTEAEDADGFEDEDGCPEPDNDQDGVLDVDDKCPTVAGAPVFAGCPAGDLDGDLILDFADVCPEDKGTFENQGCPAPSKVALSLNRVRLLEKVVFEAHKYTFKPQSYALLDELAELLCRHEGMNVQIQNHRDGAPREVYGMRLTDRRAKSVRKYLISKGIAASRLEAVGYGEDRPIEPNDTAEGRAANRRTEVWIMSRDGVVLGPDVHARSSIDTDGDGIADVNDGCPDKAGWIEREGC